MYRYYWDATCTEALGYWPRIALEPWSLRASRVEYQYMYSGLQLRLKITQRTHPVNPTWRTNTAAYQVSFPKHQLYCSLGGCVGDSGAALVEDVKGELVDGVLAHTQLRREGKP